jgi:hypothetical protein
VILENKNFSQAYEFGSLSSLNKVSIARPILLVVNLIIFHKKGITIVNIEPKASKKPSYKISLLLAS